MPKGVYIRTEENTKKIKKYHQTEKYKQEARERANKQFSDPKQRELSKKIALERYKNPEERKKLKESILKSWQTEERQKNASIAQIKRFSNPDERKKSKERAKGINKGEKNGMFGMQGKKHPSYKGGRKKNDGYVLILSHEHPFVNKNGYILEHRLVAEKELGRYLTPEEVIHHINGIKDDNRPENLYLFETLGKHIGFHNSPYFLTSNII